ncbi:uncharacterized protein LOC121372868 [Gigantopelta aegis]|uniref:uncharacterized protein LOC121372868 n=1 Tax=Gigantopelta aegis TaxID=1735272 RepID=UPI001B88C64D|nr:uncharacterized protein LOC121372868 [Gigantopelta aegis]
MAGNGLPDTDHSLTDLQARKQEYIFDLLFDISHDRNLSRQDFNKLQKLMLAVKGLTGRCQQSRSIQNRLAGIWSGLIKSSKNYRKNPLQLHLSVFEWLVYWSDVTKAAKTCGDWPTSSVSGEADYQWHHEFIDLMFEIFDTNNDNHIDEEEYCKCLIHFGVPETSCRKAFNTLSLETSKQGINHQQFKDFWLEFILSDNVSDTGNYLFGDPFVPRSEDGATT